MRVVRGGKALRGIERPGSCCTTQVGLADAGSTCRSWTGRKRAADALGQAMRRGFDQSVEEFCDGKRDGHSDRQHQPWAEARSDNERGRDDDRFVDEVQAEGHSAEPHDGGALEHLAGGRTPGDDEHHEPGADCREGIETG